MEPYHGICETYAFFRVLILVSKDSVFLCRTDNGNNVISRKFILKTKKAFMLQKSYFRYKRNSLSMKKNHPL